MVKLNSFQNQKLIFLVSLIFIFLISLVSAASNAWPNYNYCCEKTTGGAWCQNVEDQTKCDADFKQAPVNCDGTSFCKLGCCLDSSEGLCMGNTPKKVCDGNWIESSSCNAPQCELGCCIIGDQAAFVTQTRCKKLSGFYGIETDFRSNVADEWECSSLAYNQDKGACVYEENYQRICKFTTRSECLGNKVSTKSDKEFYKDYLCTAANLSTNCAPTSKTMCVEGKDEVYFMDTCGNPANIYFADLAYRGSFEEWEKEEKIKDEIKNYWTNIVTKDQSCGAGESNAESSTCGNCDYFLSSICAQGGSTTFGDSYCSGLDCPNIQLNDETYDYKGPNVNPKNGESWCVDVGMGSGNVNDLLNNKPGDYIDRVGSRSFRYMCFNGEIIKEPCSDFRKEICVESDRTNFKEAACVLNRWEDCADQKFDYDCLNTDKRDCNWIAGKDDGNNPISAINYCIPKHSPGLNFWEKSDANSVCSLGKQTCKVKYEETIKGKGGFGQLFEVLGRGIGGMGGIFGSKSGKEAWSKLTNLGNPKENKICASGYNDAWLEQRNNICASLGDCGVKMNWIEKEGMNGSTELKYGGLNQGTDNSAAKSDANFGQIQSLIGSASNIQNMFKSSK